MILLSCNFCFVDLLSVVIYFLKITVFYFATNTCKHVHEGSSMRNSKIENIKYYNHSIYYNNNIKYIIGYYIINRSILHKILI